MAACRFKIQKVMIMVDWIFFQTLEPSFERFCHCVLESRTVWYYFARLFYVKVSVSGEIR
jgi:hypothetical protein